MERKWPKNMQFIDRTEGTEKHRHDTSWGGVSFAYVCLSDTGRFPDAIEKPNLFLHGKCHRVVHTPVLRDAETRNRYKGTTWALMFSQQWKVMIKEDKTPQYKELKHSSCVPRIASFYKWKKDWVEYSGRADTKSYSLPVWLPSHRSLHHSSLASDASAI